MMREKTEDFRKLRGLTKTNLIFQPVDFTAPRANLARLKGRKQFLSYFLQPAAFISAKIQWIIWHFLRSVKFPDLVKNIDILLAAVIRISPIISGKRITPESKGYLGKNTFTQKYSVRVILGRC